MVWQALDLNPPSACIHVSLLSSEKSGYSNIRLRTTKTVKGAQTMAVDVKNQSMLCGML